MVTKHRRTSAPSTATPARKAALELVRRSRESHQFLSAFAPHVLGSASLEGADKAFARLLAQGALSLQVTLDALINEVLRTPRDIQDDVRDALRISAYEIIYLHKEDHAAVDQGVELVRSFAPRATGVANYVLHRIVEAKERFPEGDPETSLEAAARFYGFPEWLAVAIKKDIGTRNAIALMARSLEPAPVYFSANELSASHDEIARLLETSGIEFNTHHSLAAEAYEANLIFELAHRGDVGSVAFGALLHDEQVIVSDASAQSIVMRAVEVLPKDACLLEIGAGRGVKTLLFQSECSRHDIQLAEYDALDLSAKKLSVLEERVAKAGGNIVSVMAHDATKPLPVANEAFDLIFIDAPCTGLGTLRRHPEIKARLHKEDTKKLSITSQAMLAQAAPKVKPGGHLMFATCTILKEENEKTVRRFLASPAGSAFEIVPIGTKGTLFFKTPFDVGADLHFAALLQKKR